MRIFSSAWLAHSESGVVQRKWCIPMKSIRSEPVQLNASNRTPLTVDDLKDHCQSERQFWSGQLTIEASGWDGFTDFEAPRWQCGLHGVILVHATGATFGDNNKKEKTMMWEQQCGCEIDQWGTYFVLRLSVTTGWALILSQQDWGFFRD